MNIISVRVLGFKAKYAFVVALALVSVGMLVPVHKVYAAAPETFILTGPDAISEDTTPTFEFEASETATFQCRIDGGAFSPCVSPFTTPVLPDGAHAFEVKATNDALEVDASPAVRNWTVSALDGIFINDCVELQKIGTDSYYTSSQNYVLAGDIDCTDTANWNSGTGWMPLTSFADKFSGTFDGAGHTISNLYISREPGGTQGFFKYSNNASFSDFTINGIVDNPSSLASTCLGGVVGFATGYVQFSNVTVNVDISGIQNTAGGFVGCMNSTEGDSYFHDSMYDGTISTGAGSGLIGEAHLYDTATMDLLNVGVAGTIHVDSQTGGLFGIYSYDWDNTSTGNQLTITNTNAIPDMLGSSYVGGFIGSLAMQHLGASITSSSFGGTIGSSDGNVGGFIGLMQAVGDGTSESTISGSFVSTGIVAEGDNVGGFIGKTNANQILNIQESYGAGILSSNGFDYIGGLVGLAEGETNVTNSYADVALYGNTRIGGLFGSANAAIIDNSFALSEIHSTNSQLGGIAGSLGNSEINNSFAATTIDSLWPTTIGGLAGALSDSVITNSYTDTSIGNKGCDFTSGAESNNTVDCTEIDEANYFFNNVSDEPMFSWDFADIWRTNSSFYPCLQWQDFCQSFEPQVQCEVPVATDESIHGICSLLVRSGYDYGEVAWEARYKLASDTEYTTITLDDPSNADATVGGLLPYTDYYMEFRYTNNWGTGDWERIEFRTIPSADDDGIPNAVEQAAPNNGDGNNDGTTDLNQSNVGSYKNTSTKEYVVVEVGQGCVLSDIHTLDESSNAVQDNAFNYGGGLVGFSADCGSNGAQTTAKIYFYGQTKDNVSVRKYNPTTKSYFTISTDNNLQLQQTTIGSKTVSIASYTIKDGGTLDSDGLENGVIVDPVGLGTSTLTAPNTGLRAR